MGLFNSSIRERDPIGLPLRGSFNKQPACRFMGLSKYSYKNYLNWGL